MPFRRFFERGTKREQADVDETPAGEETEETEEEVESEDLESDDDGAYAAMDGEDAVPEDAKEIDWRARALAVLPTGASTGSKRAEALFGDASAVGPTHFVNASGCRVVDPGGRTYIDCTMALGAVALGYGETRVQQAAMEAVAGGYVCGLSDVREVELAERLCQHIPCAEMVQFLKSGADGMSAAIRIARTYTNRDLIVGSGYFGWHDWSSDAAGVPQATRDLFRGVPFDDVAALEQAARDAGDRLAAIVIEPVVERLPSEAWINAARNLASSLGAVLVFDEMKTGFRLRPGGYQALVEVTPDLAVFGKALSNGLPLAAVVGKRDVMEAARRTWISSTLASESVALAAAGAVLDWHDGMDVCGQLAIIGKAMQDGVRAAIDASGVSGVTVDGIDPMWLLRFEDRARETRFLEIAASHGVLFKRGAYNFAAIAHDEEALTAIESGASAAFVELLEEESGER
jgi:glutamate-1-semialdehyde aminotransferase